MGHWAFDEGSGLTAQDASVNGHDGTLINGPAWTPAGQLAGALDFDGINDYVDTGNWDVSGTGITIAARFKADTFIVPDADNRIISKSWLPSYAGSISRPTDLRLQ